MRSADAPTDYSHQQRLAAEVHVKKLDDDPPGSSRDDSVAMRQRTWRAKRPIASRNQTLLRHTASTIRDRLLSDFPNLREKHEKRLYWTIFEDLKEGFRGEWESRPESRPHLIAESDWATLSLPKTQALLNNCCVHDVLFYPRFATSSPLARRWILRCARLVHQSLLENFPNTNPRLLMWVILESFRLAFRRSVPCEPRFQNPIFRHGVFTYGLSVFSRRLTVPSISLGFRPHAPHLRSKPEPPWVVEMVIDDKCRASFRIKWAERRGRGIIRGQGRRSKARIRQILRLASALDWNGEGRVLIIGMPTIARVLGLGDFYFFHWTGRRPFQWVLAFERYPEIITSPEWKAVVAEAKRQCADQKRERLSSGGLIRLGDCRHPPIFRQKR